jgi:putative DNA primase/helicase
VDDDARRLLRIRLDPHVERPWQRTGFRHPDLMVWVRANRARLVAACLTLCQAWIAAGKPRGGGNIGSFENWAHVMGGVLEVAGIEGFLGNLEEMMEASDTEGAGWSAFIAAWWDRFGTAEVAAADLFDVAVFCDPAPAISGHTERAQKTAFGMSLTKMRDRVFGVSDRKVRMRSAGTYRRAARWKLELFMEAGAPSAQPKDKSECEPRGAGVNLQNRGSHGQPADLNGKCEPCEPCEPFSTPTHTRTRAHMKEEAGTGSQGSQGSQTRTRSDGYGCEP